MPRRLILSACLAAALALCAVPAQARLVLRGVGAPPLSDGAARALVHRSSFEPRPENWTANHTAPTAGQLRYFRQHSDMPYRDRVTGRFKGTTDEILQWGARKWGFSPELFRAVAVVESWWRQSTVGDSGSSFGLMQVRVPYHCCYPLIARSTAFDVDYYGANLRALFDGRYGWLNDVEHGRTYRAGDLWGSVGEWASGRWYAGTSASYVAQVQQRMRERTWVTDRWF